MDVTRPASLTASGLAKAADAVGATLVFASPAALRNVAATAGSLNAEQRRALDGIRLVLSTGAPVSPALLRKVQAVLPRAELHTPYGMTEALPIADISLAEIESVGPGNGVCVGLPLAGVRVTVSPLDPWGAATGELTSEAGITGEVCVAAAHVKDRYDQLWATEQASSRNAGWHRTGDVGHLDDQGWLWIEGRLVHVVTTAEGPVTPVAIEHRVEVRDEVEAAAVVGVGPVGAQQVVVVMVPSPRRARGVLADPTLAAAVRSVAGVPVAAVLVVKQLPTDIRHQSKIDRQRLARWAEDVLSGGPVRRP
jgi:acyl-coenzyme A synthetase/AMP-(fatty) acid ligase